MYDVFRSIMLKDKMAHHKFECCATSGDKMYIGTSEGAVMVYQLVPRTETYETKGLQIERTKSKQPITQIVTVPQLNVLILVSGGILAAHSMDDIVEVAQVKGLKEVMMIDIKKEKDHFYIAVIVRKKVLIYELRDTPDKFHKLREYSLPEGVKTINWLGKNVMIGFKKEYVMLDVSKQDSTPVTCYPTSKMQIPITCNMVPMREMEIGMDAVGIRVNFDGYPTSKKGITWPSLPTCLCYHHPFVLSIHDQNSIEVRMPFINETEDRDNTALATGGLCQYVTIKYVDKISIMGAVVDYDIAKPGPGADTSVLRRDCIIATTSVNSIYLIEMIPIRDQISQLAASRNFEAALELCSLCPGEVTDKDVNVVHMHFGLDYFSKKQFGKAMENFKRAKACPRFVISLFPKFLAGYIEERYRPEIKNKNPIDPRELTNNLEAALIALLSFIEPLRDPPAEPIIDREPPYDEHGMIHSAIDTAILRAFVMLKRDAAALNFLQKPNRCVVKDTEGFLKSSRQWVLLAMLWYGKGDHRPSLEMLRILGEFGRPETGLGEEDITHPTLTGTPVVATVRRMLQQDLITKMVMTQSAIENAAAGCIPKDVEDPDSLKWQVVGAVTTVSYLRQLDGSVDNSVEKALILEHSQWVLSAFEPFYTLRIFTESKHPIPPDEVVVHLEVIESTAMARLPLCATYLEIVLGESCNGIDDSNLHNKRAAALIKLVQEERAPNEDKTTASQQKLEKFLDRSLHYEPQIVVQWLQQGEYARSFYKERSIVYRKMRNHAAAINMFLNEVNKMSEALRYATEVSKEEGDAFKLLLQYVLKPDSSGQVRRIEEAIEVINTCEGVDATSALPMLPGETKLCKLSDFIKISLRNVQAKRRNRELYHHTLTSLVQQCEVAARQVRSKRCIIESETLCVRCRKKIRDTNFARYPNGILVHQACVDEEHVDPISGKDYKVSNLDAIFTV